MKLLKQVGRAIPALLLLVIYSGESAHAGNFIAVTLDGVVYKWDPSVAVPFNPDRGNLGILSNTAAVNLVRDSAGLWDNSHIPTSSLSFVDAGMLQNDVVTAEDFSAIIGVVDDISPIVFDVDGSMFADLGFDPSVLGFAGPDIIRTVSPFYITEGIAAINGAAIENQADVDDARATMAHEFGHYLNLAHTQVNGHFFFGDTDDPGFKEYGTPPRESVVMMFWTLFAEAAKEPAKDDIHAISTLYPAPGFPDNFGTIEGWVFEANGVKPFSGANIVARNPADPFFDAVSNTTGNRFVTFRGNGNDAQFDGFYQISGLTAGTSYTVEMVNIQSQSDIAQFDPPEKIPGPEEFWDENESGADTDDPTNFTLVMPNGTVSDVNFIINKVPVDVELTSFVDPVNTIASVQSLLGSATTPNGPNDYAAVRFSIPASIDTPFTVARVGFYNNDRTIRWSRMLITAANPQGQPDLGNPIAEITNFPGGPDTSLALRPFSVERRSFEDLFVVVQFPPGESLTGIGRDGGPGIGGNSEFEIGFQDYFEGNFYSTDGVNFQETITTAGIGDVDAINWNIVLVIPENAKPDDFEPNNDLNSAAPIVYGKTIKGSIDPFGELDYFRFNGSTGDLIQADVRAKAQNSELDGLITLLDSAGDTLAVHDDRIVGIFQDPRLQFVLPTTGEYFLAIDSWNRTGENNPVGGVDFFYELHLDTFVPPFEPNNSPATAAAVDTSDAIAAAIDVDDDIDFYAITSNGEELLSAQMAIGASSMLPVLTLFDTDGSTVLATEEGRSLKFNLAGAGTYFLAIADMDDLGGSDFYYQLTVFLGQSSLVAPINLSASGSKDRVVLDWTAPVIVEQPPRVVDEVEPNDDTSTAQDISGDLPVVVNGNAEVVDQGSISLVDNMGNTVDDLEDLYRITTTSRGLIIDLTDFSADLDLFIIDLGVTTILAQSGEEGTSDERIDDPTLPAGSYFIAVSIFDSEPIQNTSSYTMTVTNDEAGSGAPVLQSFNVYRSESAGARTNGEVIGNVLNSGSVLKTTEATVDNFTFVDSLLPINTFFYQVTALYNQGESPPSNEVAAVVTSIGDPDGNLPTDYALSQNYPNPFNPSTVIRFAIPLLHNNQTVTLDVFNMLGQKVRTLLDEERSAGFYTLEWDGKNDQDKLVTSGLYLYRIQAGSFVEVKKMLFLK